MAAALALVLAATPASRDVPACQSAQASAKNGTSWGGIGQPLSSIPKICVKAVHILLQGFYIESGQLGAGQGFLVKQYQSRPPGPTSPARQTIPYRILGFRKTGIFLYGDIGEFFKNCMGTLTIPRFHVAK